MIDFVVKYWVQVLFAAICSGLGGLWAAGLTWHKKQRALEAGVQALLRDRLIRTCEHYLEVGSIPVYGMENIDKMFEAYDTLHGNGAVKKLVAEAKRLPTRY